MRLVLLGTTGYHPNERRHTPCLLLPECGVMLDAGTGVFRTAEYLTGPSWTSSLRTPIWIMWLGCRICSA